VGKTAALFHVFIQNGHSTLSLENVEKTTKCVQSFGPQFVGSDNFNFLWYIVGTIFTVHHLAKFGRVLFADLRLQSLAIK